MCFSTSRGGARVVRWAHGPRHPATDRCVAIPCRGGTIGHTAAESTAEPIDRTTTSATKPRACSREPRARSQRAGSSRDGAGTNARARAGGADTRAGSRSCCCARSRQSAGCARTDGAFRDRPRQHCHRRIASTSKPQRRRGTNRCQSKVCVRPATTGTAHDAGWPSNRRAVVSDTARGWFVSGLRSGLRSLRVCP